MEINNTLPAKNSNTLPSGRGSNVNKLRASAIRLLARREHSRFELRQKLIDRDFAPDIVDSLLVKLIEQNLLSDQRFIENYIHARVNKGYGPLRIAAELNQRGVAQELIIDHLNTLTDVWQEKITAVYKKRFGKKIPKDFNERAKQMRFLQQRGFTIEQIKKLVI